MRGLDEERRYADRCRDALHAMVTGARENVVVGEDTWGDRYTAERLGYHLKSLARELADEGDGPPFFGLVGYRDDEQAQEHRGQLYYLGRRHIADAIGRPPLVIDWRAPVATTFYRATAEDPQGIAVRRRFGWSGDKLTSLEDEALARAEQTAGGRNERDRDTGEPERADGSRSTGGVDGARGIGGILRAEIERPRVGPMRDIVATIQPEQDVLVRAELAESICVQGAPGTGKTAVGLHRAAYLLYAHRARLQRSGVLVLGPNQQFLQYISAVLPTLGEVEVEQTTIDQPLAVGIEATDSPEAAVVKHDARMADILRRVLYRRIGTPTAAVVVPDSSYRWRVDQYDFEQMVDEARAEATTYGLGRERVVSRLVAALQRQAESRGQNCTGGWQRRMARAVSPAVDAVWPVAKSDEVLAEFLSDPFGSTADQGGRAGETDGQTSGGGGLSSEELAVIMWKRPRKAKSARWTAADAVLLDELAALIARGPGYGHTIVDEAQDLSPMQCRAIARRSEHGSLTVLGDLAQGTTPWAARSWAEQLEHLGKPGAEIVALTTGYRVPAVVVELANKLLATLADEQAIAVPPTVSFRADGRLTVLQTDDLAGQCTESVRLALKEEGSIGVIAADHAAAGLTDVLRAEGLVGDRLTVVPASLAKGLEYDHVIVVEPADVVEAEPRGMNRLYVVLTRAVSRLDVLHRRPLPIALT